jgi:hypothetical protein
MTPPYCFKRHPLTAHLLFQDAPNTCFWVNLPLRHIVVSRPGSSSRGGCLPFRPGLETVRLEKLRHRLFADCAETTLLRRLLTSRDATLSGSARCSAATWSCRQRRICQQTGNATPLCGIMAAAKIPQGSPPEHHRCRDEMGRHQEPLS